MNVLDIAGQRFRKTRRATPYFPGALFVVTVVMIILLRFMWPSIVLLFVLFGVTSPATALGVIVGLVILGAAALHERLARRPF